METLVYFVRHGQTEMNVSDRFRSRLDIPLNEKGKQDAEDAARNLANVGLTAVYTSPLQRAVYVADKIAEKAGLSGDRIVKDPRLIQLEYGDWTGLTKQESAESDPEMWDAYAHRPWDCILPSGENMGEGIERTLNALRVIGRNHPGEKVAAVSHGAIVRLAVAGIDGNYSNSSWQFKFPTGDYVLFGVRGYAVRVIEMPKVLGDKTDEVSEPLVQT